MLNLKRLKKKTNSRKNRIQQQMDILLDAMSNNITDEEWKRLNKKYKKYAEMVELENKNRIQVSPDTALLVGANLLGIILILHREEFDVVRSAAVQFVMKGRIK